jgi:hypothetical protein
MKLSVMLVKINERGMPLWGYEVEIEGRDYAHIHKKASRRCQYRKHVYGETWKVGKMMVVK